MHLKFIVLALCLTLVHASVLAQKKSCSACNCPKENNPICVNEDSETKKFVTYKNPCEWICHAKCSKPTSRFLHCGECDERRLPRRGYKWHPKHVTCLESELKKKRNHLSPDQTKQSSKQ